MSTNENLSPNVIRELAKELKHLDEAPPEGIKVIVDDDNFANIQAEINGPAGTPYENGVFRMKLVLPHDFPLSAPKGFFITKIFHPNVAINGEICVNALKKDWNPTLGLRHVLVVVRCLLIEPFPESALNEQAGKMLIDDYEAYARHARLLTGIHALKPNAIQESVAISESTTALNVLQTNTVVKESITTTTSASPAPLSPCMSVKGNRGPDANISLNAAATEASAVVKKDVVAKTLVDKKKMEARKKSLKRL